MTSDERMAGPAVAPLPLPAGIASRIVEDVQGLRMHLLEAGDPSCPTVLLLHGFPELAFSWRRIMPALAAAGWHVMAPDQRGYGRTTGWAPGYDVDLAPYRMLGLVRDVLGLLWATGRREVACVVGHDFGSPVAAWCAMLRPDVFRRVVLMSAPFAGIPHPNATPVEDIHGALRALDPPRKHYQWFYSERGAAADMLGAPQGLAAFLRAYFHMKGGEWPGNRPAPLAAWTAPELARLPEYYVMRADRGMAATVAPATPAYGDATGAWLPDDELAIYAAEYGRTGFQGGLNWYRARTSGLFRAEEETFAGRIIDVPCRFIAGARDWGIHQVPGALDRMRTACSRFEGYDLIEGAGHWVQQERPVAVNEVLLRFLGPPDRS